MVKIQEIEEMVITFKGGVENLSIPFTHQHKTTVPFNGGELMSLIQHDASAGSQQRRSPAPPRGQATPCSGL